MLAKMFLLLQTVILAIPLDSARVENGRLVVEPVGVSFAIPSLWLAGSTPYGGPCDQQSPRSRRVNTTPDAIRRLSGEPDYYADHMFSALSDSAFPLATTVAHLGAHGWRECDNSYADLQVRVNVTDDSISGISARLRRIKVVPKFRGYSVPVLASPIDSAGWHIERFNYSFNCGDCLFDERVEVVSRIVGRRMVSLVFMYSPGLHPLGAGSDPESDRRTILATFVEK